MPTNHLHKKLIRIFKEELWCWIEAILRPWPGRIGMYGRGLIFKIFFNANGKGIKISEGTHIWNPNNVFLGNNVRIGRGSHLNAVEKIKIGSNVSLGPYVIITSANHNYTNINIPINKQGLTAKEIIINDDVWIGTFSVILPGIMIGKGSIIAASAVVTKNVPSGVVVAGVPAKIIHKRNIND